MSGQMAYLKKQFIGGGGGGGDQPFYGPVRVCQGLSGSVRASQGLSGPVRVCILSLLVLHVLFSL